MYSQSFIAVVKQIANVFLRGVRWCQSIKPTSEKSFKFQKKCPISQKHHILITIQSKEAVILSA